MDEKRSHPGSSPYRCLDCSHRFLSRKAALFEKDLVVSVWVALPAVVLVAVVTFLLTSARNASAPPQAKASVKIEPELLKAAEMGNAAAQLQVGEALFHDPAHSSEKSAQAVRWLQLAAESGNTEAMVLLGRLFRSGVGILQDFSRSATWIQTAASRGDVEGMLELGRLYRDGVGLDKDPVRAYAWFNRAAAAHNLDAQSEREAVARMLTVEELKEAQALSSTISAGGGAEAKTPK